MPRTRHPARPVVAAVLFASSFGILALARADSVILKNGIVYRGAVDKDNTILWVYDGLKRVVVRD